MAKKNSKKENANLKIMTIYHKKDILFKNDFIEPIHVGRELARNRMDSEQLQFMCENMLGDDEGDNISSKNMSYNEMTAVYWCWKNYEKIGSPKYIGFMHYRRHFMMKDMPRAYYECNNISEVEDYLKNELDLSEEKVLEVLSDYDFIVTKPYYKDSVYNHYKEAHHIEDLELALDILNEKYPEFKKSADKYIYGHYAYFCNMFIMPKDIFFNYAEWLFDILQTYEERTDITGKRLFISERLTGVYFQYLMDNGYKAAVCPTMYVEENVTIPLVFATDYKYLTPTAVAITSVLENAKKTTFFDIFVMVSENIYDIAVEKMKSLSDRYSQCKINVVNMKDHFSEASMTIKHITYQTYYRLLIPDLLKYNKCLYLDSDIIVNGDLTNFFRTNIDEFYIAGVKAAGYYYPPSKVPAYLEKTGLESIEQYVNAGIILMNLKRMREDNIVEKWLKYVDKNLPGQDQDILNIFCYNNIKILPYKYNLMTKYLEYDSEGKIVGNEIAKYVYDEKEIVEAIENPLIIHYADKVKPWEDNVILAQKWREMKMRCPMTKAKVTVIVPVYNVEEYLTQALDSVFAQTLSDVCVICVNDGSTDNSAKILEEYQKKYANLIIVNQKNMGVAVARNKAIEIANSEFICFLDPDDFYPEKDILEVLYNKAKEKNVMICGGSWSELIDGKYKYEFGSKHNKYVFDEEMYIDYKDYQFDFGYQRFIFNLDFVNKHQFRFPLYRRYQDPPFFAKCMIAANRFYAVNKVTYCYRLGHQTATILEGRKARDFLMGVIDMLRISERNNLVDLHYLQFERLNKVYRKRIGDFILNNNDRYLFELLIRANTAINRRMLAPYYKNVTENTMLAPLSDIQNQYYENNAKLARTSFELSETRKSFSYKIGLFITWIPRTIRSLVNRQRGKHK